MKAPSRKELNTPHHKKSVPNKPPGTGIPIIATQPPRDHDKMEFELETVETVTKYKELCDVFQKLFPAAIWTTNEDVLHFYNTQNVRATRS